MKPSSSSQKMGKSACKCAHRYVVMLRWCALMTMMPMDVPQCRFAPALMANAHQTRMMIGAVQSLMNARLMNTIKLWIVRSCALIMYNWTWAVSWRQAVSTQKQTVLLSPYLHLHSSAQLPCPPRKCHILRGTSWTYIFGSSTIKDFELWITMKTIVPFP